MFDVLGALTWALIMTAITEYDIIQWNSLCFVGRGAYKEE